ncbi:MAG: phosphomannomutase/phosphoglucomutase [Bdellovibrionales bacterium]|nr:phosphomannomutase/phosphoglucomutase [Bdellovibrionales bacterium]
MKLNPLAFREYDIRGVVDEDLSPEFARLLGRTYSLWLGDDSKLPVSIGYDCRLSSPAYAQALAEGISSTGREVQLLGMGPTPQVYFSLYQRELAGGIQVTGSHNPSNMNGFKICKGKSTISGSAIQELYQGMKKAQNDKIDPRPELIKEAPLLEQYITYLADNIKPHLGSRKLKVVVDAGNGVGGIVGPEMLKRLGIEVVELYCDPDGNFPNHHPDPTEMENIVDLKAAVLREKADCGIGWDGDGDRIGVVDEKGEIVFGDMLLLLYGRALIEEVQHPTIIGDVKCSSRLFNALKEAGATPIMWKTGHSLIKQKLYSENAALAGEMSGHMFFKHRFFGFDDALYATGRFVELLSKTDKQVSELLTDLPPAVSTPEIRVECPDEKKFEVPKAAEKVFANYTIDLTDGVRVEFEKGWGLVRASNTQPALVMRFEAETEELLKEYQKTMTDGVNEILATL